MILASLVSELDDYHVDIRADGFDYSGYQRPADSPLVRHWRNQFVSRRPNCSFYAFILPLYYKHVSATMEAIANQLVGQFATAANNQLAWGVLPNQVGYLSVRQMAGFADQADPQIQYRELAKALDLALAELADTRGMIPLDP